MMDRPVVGLIRNQIPLTLPPDATVREACRSMRDRHVGSVVVTDEQGRLLGIFTERDAVCRVLAEAGDAELTTLATVMTQDPSTLSPRGTAMEALRLMQDGGFNHVPVVEGRRVVAIVSYADFLGLEHTRLEEETEVFERLR
jgi:CBS domain-containing protein